MKRLFTNIRVFFANLNLLEKLGDFSNSRRFQIEKDGFWFAFGFMKCVAIFALIAMGLTLITNKVDDTDLNAHKRSGLRLYTDYGADGCQYISVDGSHLIQRTYHGQQICIGGRKK